MALIEIERKFLVKGDYKPFVTNSTRIAQGYLVSDGKRSVRIRTRDDKGYITVKGKTDAAGMSRFEWEKEIPVEEARLLLKLSATPLIDKTRSLVKNTDGIHTWEVDEFYGPNEGLTVAEIELSSEDEPFDKPDWLGEEVTGDHRYYNSHLTMHPYCTWKEEEK